MRFSKVPKIDRKTGAQTGWRFKFWTYNPNSQRNEAVPVDLLPGRGSAFLTDEDAQRYCDLKSAEDEAIKLRAQKRIEWKTKYYDFNGLLDGFARDHQAKAPNSWENDVYWLESYVFHFFLDIKASNNVNNWSFHFDDFRNWLRTVKPLKYKKETLALNSANKAIKALNLFLGFLARRGLCQDTAKCPVFPKHELKRSTADDVLEECEARAVHQTLLSIRPASADLFQVLLRTGLRINEALGLCLPFVVEGEIEGRKSRRVHEALARYGLEKYFGYICLESQPKLTAIRDESGRIPRKPLKHRREIAPQWFRYIPVLDRDAWDIVAKRANQQVDSYEKRERGDDLRDYLLFDGLTASMFYADLQEALRRAKIRPRGPHKLRHTYLTWFYDAVSGDTFLAEAVAGHRDKATMEVYDHSAEQRGREALLRQGIRRFRVAS